LLSPESGELLYLQDLRDRPGTYSDLLALAGTGPAPDVYGFGSAELLLAVHPYALYSSVLQFDAMLSPVQSRPAIAVRLPEGALEGWTSLWSLPAEALEAERDPAAVRAANRQDADMLLIREARLAHLQDANAPAAALYRTMEADLQLKRSLADVPEGIAVIDAALDNIAYFRGANAYDAGAHDDARRLLKAYLEDHAEGRWRDQARLLLAESLQQVGNTPEATRVLGSIEGPRRLYAQLKLHGFLPAYSPTISMSSEAAAAFALPASR
jgi:hypothetical protein